MPNVIKDLCRAHRECNTCSRAHWYWRTQAADRWRIISGLQCAMRRRLQDIMALEDDLAGALRRLHDLEHGGAGAGGEGAEAGSDEEAGGELELPEELLLPPRRVVTLADVPLAVRADPAATMQFWAAQLEAIEPGEGPAFKCQGCYRDECVPPIFQSCGHVVGLPCFVERQQQRRCCKNGCGSMITYASRLY